MKLINRTRYLKPTTTALPAPSFHNEHELLTQLARGEEPAFRAIYDHYRNKIFTLAFQLTRSESASLDVIQDIFVKLWLNKEQLPEINNFNAYLNTLTRNHLHNAFRRIAIENTYLKSLLSDDKLAIENAEIDAGLRQEIRMLYEQALEKLSPQQRKVYVLGKQQGFKYEEIAQQLNISRDTVKEYMAQAKRVVLQHFKNNEYGLIILSIALTKSVVA